MKRKLIYSIADQKEVYTLIRIFKSYHLSCKENYMAAKKVPVLNLLLD